MLFVLIPIFFLLNLLSHLFFDSMKKDLNYRDLVPKWVFKISKIPPFGLVICILLISFGMLLIILETLNKHNNN
jgi:hypothetical protein